MLEAWFDGLVEPFQPGGIPTYGFLVKRDGVRIHEEHGMAEEPFTPNASSLIAEYEGLLRCLRWLVAITPGEEVLIRGDNLAVISQVRKKIRIDIDYLKTRHAEARQLMAQLPGAHLERVPREENTEADELTHRSYIKFVDEHPEIHHLLPLATAKQLEALERKGIPTYRYMGRMDAQRLLQRAHEQEERRRTPSV